jgi:hypothetical protein
MAVEVGEQAAGYSLKPRATRDACQMNSVIAIDASNSRMLYACCR